MKRLLLSLCLVGIVFAGYAHPPLQTNRLAPSAGDPPANERAVSIVAKNSIVHQVALKASEAPGILQQPLPEASVGEIFAPALPAATKVAAQSSKEDGTDDVGLWVTVIRGAWMHSAPSVSAPITGHRSPGTDLHLIGQEDGWYQVLDPVTRERGWIYAQYYLEPTDGPGKKRVVLQEPKVTVSVNAAPAAAAPTTRAARRVLQQPNFLAPPQVERAAARPRLFGEGVASLLERALRR